MSDDLLTVPESVSFSPSMFFAPSPKLLPADEPSDLLLADSFSFVPFDSVDPALVSSGVPSACGPPCDQQIPNVPFVDQRIPDSPGITVVPDSPDGSDGGSSNSSTSSYRISSVAQTPYLTTSLTTTPPTFVSTQLPFAKMEAKSPPDMSSDALKRKKRTAPLADIPDERLEPDQLAKRMRRRQRNKESAQQSRQRKKQFVDELSQQVQVLTADNAVLQSQLREVMAYNDSLKRTLMSHGLNVPAPLPRSIGLFGNPVAKRAATALFSMALVAMIVTNPLSASKSDTLIVSGRKLQMYNDNTPPFPAPPQPPIASPSVCHFFCVFSAHTIPNF
eukprot:c9336_g1_i2.p1 GENE.c9336_g1_i2~~c9336_g1_i2.p1  ORF type:complete len:344 (+),score=64.06 c9336_g1_i2:36-1034(+)